MASALRVTGRLALAGTGGFGERVACLLAERFPGSRAIPADDLAGAFATDVMAVVVAVPRSSWAVCDHADALAYLNGKPWLPVVMEHPMLRVGPLILPPSGPCFGCYQARRLQHDTEYEASAALAAVYDGNASLHPEGYLPHHARLAAGVAAWFLSGTVPGAGLVFAYDVLSARGAVHPVVRCHDCGRSSGDEGTGQSLDLAEIAARLAAVHGDQGQARPS